MAQIHKRSMTHKGQGLLPIQSKLKTAMDAGSLILQASVPVFPKDTEASFSEPIRQEKHGRFPQSIRVIPQD